MRSRYRATLACCWCHGIVTPLQERSVWHRVRDVALPVAVNIPPYCTSYWYRLRAAKSHVQVTRRTLQASGDGCRPNFGNLGGQPCAQALHLSDGPSGPSGTRRCDERCFGANVDVRHAPLKPLVLQGPQGKFEIISNDRRLPLWKNSVVFMVEVILSP